MNVIKKKLCWALTIKYIYYIVCCPGASSYNGTWDHWYGPSERNGTYDLDLVYTEQVANALKKLGLMPAKNKAIEIR